MKKTLGILIIIFTFFICNNVVNGVTFGVFGETYYSSNDNDSILANTNKKYLVKIYSITNVDNSKALCIDPQKGSPEGTTSGWEIQQNDSKQAKAFASIIEAYSFYSINDLQLSITLRLLQAKIQDLGKEDIISKPNSRMDYTFNAIIGTKIKFDLITEFDDYSCNKEDCFRNTGYKYTEDGKTISSEDSYLKEVFKYYKEAVKELDSTTVEGYSLEFSKLESDYVKLKASFSLDLSYKNQENGKIQTLSPYTYDNNYYYFKVRINEYPLDNTFNIKVFTSTISRYNNTTINYQSMLVFQEPVTGVKSTEKKFVIPLCNVSPKLNPKNSNFNVTEYKNAGCLCKTYNTTKEYNQADFNAISNHAYTNDYINKNNIKAIVKTSVEKLQEEYINQCPPPCKIETSCSGLDDTCGANEVGTVSSRIVSSNNNYTLNQCLQNSNLEGKDLLYHSTKFPGVYCLEDIKVYMGKSKVLVSSAGGTFGIYPHITSKITCATKDGMISNSDIYDEYLKNFRNNTNITINEEEDSFSQTSPKFEKYTNILGDIDGDGIIDTTDARKILRFSEMLEDLSEDQKKTADIDGDGIITQTDAEIALRIASDLDKNVGGFPNKSKQSDTVYLFFYPNKLFTTPIMGKTYMINAIERNRVYNLGYTFALNYNLPLINGEIGKYNLDLTLGSKLNNKFNTTEDCKKECSGSFYFEKPELNGKYCPPEYRNPDGSLISYLERYNQNSTIYSMCDIRNSSNFNEVLCQEAIGCYSGGIDFWYRPITLNDVFPNTKNDFSIKPLSKYRVTGSNWATKKGRETQQEIEKDGEKIYKNNTSSTTKNKVYYKITLTPQNMKEIRDYNDDQEKYDEGYADFTLDCDDKGFACKSSFLTDLLDENYGDYNDNEFNLSNARNWTKYTDGTAWK